MNLENFPASETGKRMLETVSNGFYDNSYVGKWLFQVMGLEMGEAREKIEELPYQAFPETATWGLRYHEQKYGLPVREDLTYEERRKLIYKKRNHITPMTPHRMEQCLREATGFEVYVCDANDLGEFGFSITHPNEFKVVIIGEGNVDLESAKVLIDSLKQSHTVYDIVIEKPMMSKIVVGICYQEANIIEMRQVI